MSTLEIPAHVPPHLVVDFNYYDQPGGHEDPHLTWKRLHDGPDIFYTPQYGGHWVVTRGEDLRAILRDHQHFSSSRNSIPYAPRPFKLAPIENDPPEHTELKQLEIPFFTPKAITTLEQDSRALSIALIDSFRHTGRCEFVSDFALRMPIAIFMKMAGLPDEDRLMLLEWVETKVRNPDEKAQQWAYESLIAYTEKMLRERREHPGKDLVSQLVQAKFQGRSLEHMELLGFVLLLWFAGLDTVSSSMGFIMRFLATHPGHRRQLIDDPGLIPNAIEELLRRFGVSIPSRIVAGDLVYKGIEMKQGDMVLLPLLLHGMDERVYPDPLEVDFRRPNAGMHLTFGDGVHRCIGSYLARTELRVFLEEWLKLIPDFTIQQGAAVVTSTGVVNGTLRLPLEWRL